MEPIGPPQQPIVIAGGFLAAGALYEGLRLTLAELSGQPATIVPTLGPEWLMAVVRLGWAHLLRQLERTVRRAAEGSPTGKVTLVGHSAGGVLGRLYLGERPFFGRVYDGRRYVSLLITLGSPHRNRGGLTAGGKMARYVERLYPGAYYADVRYLAVAGRYLAGDPKGSGAARRSATYYRRICGDARAWGDGLVPVEAALLRGAEQVVLDGVAHYSLDGPWYGSRDVAPRWWEAALAEPVEAEPGEVGPVEAESVARSLRQAQRPAAKPGEAEAIQEMSEFQRGLWIAGGSVCLVLGIVGVFVPVLPTTPFLLLAAACYTRGSRRLHDWLLSRRVLGAYIRNYREGRGMPLWTKLVTLGLLWGTISYAALAVVEPLPLRLLLLAVAVGVTIHLLKLPTYRGG